MRQKQNNFITNVIKYVFYNVKIFSWKINKK